MKSKSVLFIGCGDLGSRSGLQLQAWGWQVAGLCRHTARLPSGFARLAADYTTRASRDLICGLHPDYVVATFNPTERSPQGYADGFGLGMENLLAGLGTHRPRAVLMVSSTRVYAENGGGWVDEASALARDEPGARAIIAAEDSLLASPHHGSIIRFAGIYGSPDSRLIARVRRGEFQPVQPAHYSNRIHRDDCAGLICHLLGRVDSGLELAPVYNGVDNLPVARHEVEAWLAAVLEAPSPGDSDTGHKSEASSVCTGKRCSNRLLLAAGYRLQYPDYRSGYSALLAADG